jgi:hypothetical protein
MARHPDLTDYQIETVYQQATETYRSTIANLQEELNHRHTPGAIQIRMCIGQQLAFMTSIEDLAGQMKRHWIEE